MSDTPENTANVLLEAHLDPDPIKQFALWFQEAGNGQIHEPEAMTLATVAADGKPTARMVLLRGFDERGFCFYTNYLSKKGKDIEAAPWVSLNFWWDRWERQVRIDGKAAKTTAAESDHYFQSRPRGHQIGAWASPQSRAIAHRAELDEEVAAVTKEYEGIEIPRPPNWGGYRVAPTTIEFWQGRPDRLHDRLCYRRQADNTWTLVRLAP